jgi:hypothetical protein
MPLLTPVSPPAAATTDFQCIGTAEINLSDILAGRRGDLVSEPVVLAPLPEYAHRYPSGVAGTLTMTLLAQRCLQRLMAER